MDINPEVWKGLSEVAVVILGFVLIAKFTWGGLIRIAELWQGVSQRRNEIDQKRNDIEQRSLDMVEQLGRQFSGFVDEQKKVEKEQIALLTDVKGGIERHDQSVVDIVIQLRADHSAIQLGLSSLETKIDSISEGLKKYPQASEEVKIELVALRRIVESLKQTFEIKKENAT